MSDWQLRPLGELTENFDSVRVPVKEGDRKRGPYPYYGASGIVDYVDAYLFEGEFLLVAEDGENLRTRQTPIAFMASGKFWVNNHAHIVTGNDKALTRFLCYALSHTDVSGFLSGSTMPKLTQGNLNRIPIIAPPLQAQSDIVDILGTLDDKIELNRGMNETLEGMAQALFKSWFVDFDPVIDNALAAGHTIPEPLQRRAAARQKLSHQQPSLPAHLKKLFPDRFYESTTMGPVPQGWQVRRVEDVTHRVTKGDTPRESAMKNAPHDDRRVKMLRVNAISADGEILIDKALEIPYSIHIGKSKRSVLEPGFILYTNAGTIGRVAYVTPEILPANTNQAIAIVQPDENQIVPIYLFMAMRRKAFQDELHQSVTQAVQANLALGKISDASLIVPPVAVLRDLIVPLQALLYRKFDNRRSNSMLTELRDTLLPRLLSGKLRIPDAEKMVAEVV